MLKATLNLGSAEELKNQCNLGRGGKAQQYIDTFVVKQSYSYTPGNHINDAGNIGTNFGSGKVVWDSPDANYLYEGKLMVDRFTYKGAFFSKNYGYWSRPNTEKILDPNGRNLEFHKRPGADHWFDKMIADKMPDLLEGIGEIILK